MFGLPLYLCNAVPSTPIKRGSNGPAYEMRKKRQKKREGKRERKEEKMWDQIAKKKKKKKKNLHALASFARRLLKQTPGVKFTKQSIVSIEIPTADVKRSIFNSVLMTLKISRSTLTDIYTNKTQQNIAIKLTESTKRF